MLHNLGKLTPCIEKNDKGKSMMCILHLLQFPKRHVTSWDEVTSHLQCDVKMCLKNV